MRRNPAQPAEMKQKNNTHALRSVDDQRFIDDEYA